uniref:WAP four-disulfide core domain protein 18-like n=1 Tax=Arvicanthis niloticus TaxID=61156 RepID=UPI00402BD72E
MKTVTVLFLVALITVEMNISCALSSTKKLEKPGACPKTSPGSIGICVEQCSGDETCPGKMKCCSNGCGHVCKIPVFKLCFQAGDMKWPHLQPPQFLQLLHYTLVHYLINLDSSYISLFQDSETS